MSVVFGVFNSNTPRTDLEKRDIFKQPLSFFPQQLSTIIKQKTRLFRTIPPCTRSQENEAAALEATNIYIGDARRRSKDIHNGDANAARDANKDGEHA